MYERFFLPVKHCLVEDTWFQDSCNFTKFYFTCQYSEQIAEVLCHNFLLLSGNIRPGNIYGYIINACVWQWLLTQTYINIAETPPRPVRSCWTGRRSLHIAVV